MEAAPLPVPPELYADVIARAGAGGAMCATTAPRRLRACHRRGRRADNGRQHGAREPQPRGRRRCRRVPPPPAAPYCRHRRLTPPRRERDGGGAPSRRMRAAAPPPPRAGGRHRPRRGAAAAAPGGRRIAVTVRAVRRPSWRSSSRPRRTAVSRQLLPPPRRAYVEFAPLTDDAPLDAARSAPRCAPTTRLHPQ